MTTSLWDKLQKAVDNLDYWEDGPDSDDDEDDLINYGDMRALLRAAKGLIALRQRIESCCCEHGQHTCDSYGCVDIEDILVGAPPNR